jgi:hypothetical protein
MTTEASVDNSKIEVICRVCGNTLLAPELAEFFNEEQLILNFWSCSNCGFRFETEEKIRSEAASQIDESDDEASLFPETFFQHRVFECSSAQAVVTRMQLACPLYPRKRTCALQPGMSALGQ